MIRHPAPEGPDLLRGLIIKGTVEDEPLADRQVATNASYVHGSEAIIVRLGDVSGRAHLEQPLADRQVATIASLVHGSVAFMAALQRCQRAHQ